MNNSFTISIEHEDRILFDQLAKREKKSTGRSKGKVFAAMLALYLSNKSKGEKL
jgi:hypothetical protein